MLELLRDPIVVAHEAPSPKTRDFGNGTCLSRLANHVSRFLVLANPCKRGMAKVIVRCPFGKFDLND